jgi:hypothetical protein
MRRERRRKNCSWIQKSGKIFNTYNTIQYNTIQYNTIQYNTIMYCELKLTGHLANKQVEGGPGKECEECEDQ